MLDIKFIRENPDVVQKAARDKNIDIDVNHVLAIDSKYRELSLSVQKLREELNKEAVKRALDLSKIKNEVTPEIIKSTLEISRSQEDKSEAIKRVLEAKEERKKEEYALRAVEEELHEWLLKIPNLPKLDVKVGKDESQNEVIRKYKEPAKLTFQPKDHLGLGEQLDIIDVKRASKVSGTRFGYLKNEGVLLEFALVQLALDILIKEKFIPVIPPALIKKEITEGLGYWQSGGNEDYYWINEPEQNQGFYLVGTAEHSIVPMHKDEVLSIKELPKRYVGFSSAFRREAGTYGKDTRGILRVHQFDKVEMVSFTTKENDDKEHEYLLSLEEKLFQLLEIPYQVVKMCTGDLGFPVARKYDIEAWLPSENKYREVTSTSTTTDFQARRLNIKYQDGNEKKYVHILNGTAFAIGRTIVAIFENYQEVDGSVVIPKVLRKYINNLEKITPKK